MTTRLKMRAVVLPVLAVATLVVVSSCASGTDTPTNPSPIPAADPWAPVDSTVRTAVAGANVPGMALVVYNAADSAVFRRVYGDFAVDREVAVASASKFVSSVLLLDLIGRGELSLGSTTAQLLGWTGIKGTITLEQLVSFTSGFPPGSSCSANPTIALEDCVAQIAQIPLLAAPGDRYEYGNTHLHVAARMAEVATGRTWNQLFRERLADPLALPSTVRFHTFPRQAIGLSNPLVAGGLRASMNDYARILALAFHRGRYGGLTVGTPALFDALSREPFPDVIVGSSPFVALDLDFRYGFGVWLECNTPATGCSVFSSPGAFGWTPWIDRTTGYYAILGMELGNLEGGPAPFSVRLAQQLKPAINAALANSIAD